MPYVYSTLTNDHNYTNWSTPSEKSMIRNVIPGAVLIKGGANLANVENPRVAPRGVVTEITDKQLEYLEQNSVFRKHKNSGLILVLQSRVDPETVAQQDMKDKDNSAPLTPKSDIFGRVGPDGETIKPMEEKDGFIEKIKGAVGMK